MGAAGDPMVTVGAGVVEAAGGAARSLVEVLPDELLERICALLLHDVCGVTHLTRLRLCCRRLHALMGTAFVTQRALEHLAPSGCVSLEHLAIHEELLNIGSNRVAFFSATSSMYKGSRARVRDFAMLLVRHKRLAVEVHAHTGIRAPSVIAPGFTRERARAVQEELEACGVEEARVSITGWGKKVAAAAGWHPGKESARAELFFSVDGVTFPPRPRAYSSAGVPPIDGAESDGHLSSLHSYSDYSDSDAARGGEADESSETGAETVGSQA